MGGTCRRAAEAYAGLTSYLKALYTSSQWRMARRVIAFVVERLRLSRMALLPPPPVHGQCLAAVCVSGKKKKKVSVGWVECKRDADTTRLSGCCSWRIRGATTTMLAPYFSLYPLSFILYVLGWVLGRGKMAKDNDLFICIIGMNHSRKI